MSFYTFEERFEEGGTGAFNTLAGSVTFPHYAEQARLNNTMPWSGAYVAKFVGSGTGDDSLDETAGFDLAADAEDFIKFLVYFDSVSLAAGESFNLFEQVATATDEGTITVRNNSGQLEIGVTEPTSTAADYADLETGRWLQLELGRVHDAGTGDDGTLTLFIDDTQVAQITSLDQGAVTSAKIGYLSSSDAGNSATFYVDHVKVHSARLGGKEPRWPHEVHVTDSQHVFIGPGRVDSIELIDGGSGDSTLEVYDTDEANTSHDRLVARLNTVNASEVQYLPVGFNVNRGCYVSLGGTTTRAMVRMGRVAAYGSQGSVKTYAKRRMKG